MFGDNPVRKPESGDGSVLYVQEIFATFQGEGPYVGWPAIFIRLGGCNLACEFCDTEFESFSSMQLGDILSEADKLSGISSKLTHGLVVITGGEPFRQPIEKLCENLVDKGYKVQIETNGTLYRKLPDGVDIICSPKVSNGKYHNIRSDLLERISALKFIISDGVSDYRQVGEVGQGEYDIPVYVQPMDEYNEEKNLKNMALAVDIAQKNGYRLSLQTHKIAGVR